MAIDPFAHCNPEIPSYNCTLETCCLAQSSFLYIPNYGGNLFFAIIFGVFTLPHLTLGIWYRTWGFAVGMVVGLVLEVVGYASRIQLHNNPFADNPFLIYLITLTIAPVFLTAAMYLCLTRIIGLFGTHLSRFQPRTIAVVFMVSDFLSLVLQAIGGAIADTANTESMSDTGAHIMVAGLFLQAVSLFVFILVLLDFAWICRKANNLDQNIEKQRVRRSTLFKLFCAALLLASVAVLIRSIFRVAELWQGFGGSIWNNETEFLVLDGAMIALAVICLTAVHPGIAFGGQWQAANWNFRVRKSASATEKTHKNVGNDNES